MKEKFEFDGVTYKYVAPENFTYRQFILGKQLLSKLMPYLLKSEALARDFQGKEIGTEVDMDKVMAMYSAVNEIDEVVNEVEIFSLMYIPEEHKKFDLEYYKKNKLHFDTMNMTDIIEMRGVLPDFFSYIYQHIAGNILTSMNQVPNPTIEPDTLSIVEPTES